MLAHNCWASHFNTPALSHQICIAHLIRDLNYLTERYAHKWSKVCKGLFQQALLLKDKMQPSDYLIPLQERSVIEKRLDVLALNDHTEIVTKNLSFTIKKKRSPCKNRLLLFSYKSELLETNLNISKKFTSRSRLI